jgi:hypothetical protein
MRINKRLICGLLMAVVFLLWNIEIVQAVEEDKLKVSHTYGYESVYKWGTLVPITIEIDNNLKNIDGEVQIEIPVANYDMGMNNNENVTVYTQNINLPLNTKKKVTLNIPISRNITSVNMNIVEDKTTLLTKELSLGTPLNPGDFIIGTLSDDFNSVSYINKISVNNSSAGKRVLNTKLVKLDENIFPEDYNILKPISVIIINNFDTSKLGKAKYDTLKKWVEKGGLLLIGTGPSQNKTLSIFKDNFISGEIGNVASVNTSALYKLLDDKSTSYMKLDALNINIKDSEAIVKEGNQTLVHRLVRGNGSVAVAAFDLGLSPLTDWAQNSSFGEKLIEKSLPDYYKDPGMLDRIMNMGNVGGYNLSYGLGNIPELPVPKASSLIIIFFIYVLIVAPVNYFILKKTDKRELMWATVPALSVVFAMVVYFSGSTTRVTKPIANVLSTIEIDDKGNQAVQSYGTVVTPKKTDIRIEAKEGMSIRPVVNLDYYKEPNQNPNSKKPTKNIYSRITSSPKTVMEFYNTGVFAQHNFIIENEEVKKGAVQTEVNFSDNKIVGTIKNNSGYDLSDCFVITSNSYINLGEIKNGEVKNLNESVKSYTGMAYEMLDTIFGRQYGGSPIRSAKQIQERRINDQKRTLIQSYLETVNMRVREAVLLGISETPVAKDILVNKDVVKKYDKSLIVSKIDLNYIKDGKAEYPIGTILPMVSSLSGNLSYDDIYGFIHGPSGEVEVKFEIDKKVKPEKIELKQPQTTSNFGPKFSPLSVKGYVWNVSSNSWEETDYNNFSIEGERVLQYVDSENIIKFKLDTTNMQQPGTIPQIYVKGSVK